MKLQLFQIDAFASRLFSGNPAAVCPLDEWLPTATMQAVAAENNLSETAFIVPDGPHYAIRWFTPLTEVKLCGHATLAAGWVIFNELGYTADTVHFKSRSGRLSVSRSNTGLELDLPAVAAEPCEAPAALLAAFEQQPLACLKNDDYILVFASEADVAAANPAMTALASVDCRGVVITATGNNCDFVLRFFAPKAGIAEDPVTGSAYACLVPYWAQALNRHTVSGQQLSSRGEVVEGELTAENRVLLRSNAVHYMTATIHLN